MTSTKAAKSGDKKKHAITNIVTAMLDVEAMDRTAKANKVKDYEGDAVQKHVVLWGFFDAAEKAGKVVAECSECGGSSFEDSPECAFCGNADEVVVTEIDDAPQPKGQQHATSVALAGTAPPSQALVPVKSSGGKILKESDLNRLIADVHVLKGGAAKAWWQLGQKVGEIKDGDKWKLRTDESGAQKFKNWDAFCKEELGIQPQSALAAMDASKQYPLELAEKYGRKKLTILVRADDSAKLELEKDIKAGASVRQLDAKAKKLKAGKPVVERGGKVRKAPASTRPAKKGDTITVAALLDAPIVAKAYKKPAKLAMLAEPKDLARAKKLGDQPAARVELPNGVCMYIVQDASPQGEIRFRVSFAREDVGDDG